MKNFLLILLIYNGVFAQDTIKNPKKESLKIDSLFDAGQFMSAYTILEKYTSFYKNYSSQYYAFRQKQAECLSRLGKIDDAQNVLNTCEVAKMTPNTSIDFKNSNGYILLKKGKIDDAIEVFKNANASCKINQKAEMAACFNNLGLANWINGNQDQATEYMLQSLHIFGDFYGQDHTKVASAYNNLGLITSATQPEVALEYYKKSLALNQKIYSTSHPNIATVYTNIGVLYKNKNEYNLALDNFENALRINIEVFGKNHPTIAFLKTAIAQVFIARNSNDKAIENLNEAKSIYEKSYEKKHPEIAQINNLLGNIALKSGNIKKALLYYQNALIANAIVFDNTNYKANPSANDCYNKLLLINILTQKAKAIESNYYTNSIKKRDLLLAAAIYEKCDTAIQSLRQTLVSKSDKIQLGGQANDVYEFAIETNVQLAEISMFKNKYLEKAFYYSEKCKASVLLESIADANAKQFAGIPDSLILIEKNLQSEISFVAQQIAQKPEIASEKLLLNKLFILKNKFNNFTQQLHIDFPEYYNLKFSYSMASASQISNVLPKGSAMCSFFVGENNNKVYTFLITNKNLKVYSSALSLPIEKQVTVLRNSIKYNLSSNFNEISAQIYKQLFPFHLPTQLKTLIIVPDGKLGTIPYEALLTKAYELEKFENAPFLIRKNAISYAYSGTLFRDAQIKNEVSTSKSALICAPVLFNNSKTANYLIALPGSETECMDVRKLLMSNKFETKTFIKDQAKESVLKNADLANYRYIHLATHGIVNELHPELSQIFLNSDVSRKEDGNLYSWEIYGLKFNASLVALSACQTGLGKVSKGEGIIGLSRALLFAGAQNVMVSLWTVSDASTSALMVDFYTKLTSQNLSLAASLQQAKLTLIKDAVYANPYYWAPFILIGK